MANDRQFIVEILNAQGVPTGRLIASRINVIESRVTGTTPSAAASLATFAGNGQSGTVGTVLTVPPSVRVTDASGLPVAGSTVTWQPGGGSGTTSTGNTSTTNSNGVAQVGSWSMGTTAGSAYTLFAYSGNLTNSPIRFSVTPTAGSAFSITMSGGTSQTTTPQGTLPSRLTVLVHDQYGNPVSGATSALSQTDDDGVLSASVITTNASGVAGFTYQAGTVASVQSIYATIPSGASVRFASTTTSGPGNRITVLAGDDQVAASSTTLPVVISGTVDDGFGNPIGSGNTVQYVIVAGSGNISKATQTPVASAWSVEWRTGAAVGQQLLEVSLQGVSSSTVTVRASATAPQADTIAVESGNTQTGTVGAALNPFAVYCTGGGSAASGQVVVFALATNPGTVGSLSTTIVVSGTSGIARTVLSLGTAVGVYTVSASAGTLTGSPLLFSATATADSASQLRVSTEPSSQVQPGVAWTQQPIITTADQYGNLVSTNTRVQAVLLSGDGTLASGISMFATASGATASFSGLSYTQTSRQSFQVGFRCNSLSTTTASIQTAAPPFATRMAFTQQPSGLAPGGAFSPTITVTLQDDGGNTVTTATDAVTLAISGSGVLSGTVTRNASGGIATFSGLGVTSGTPDGTYTLAASATGLVGATSASFAVATQTSNEPAGMTPIFGTNGITLVSGAANLTFSDVQFRDASTYTAPAFTAATPAINAPGMPPSGQTQLAEIGFAAGHVAGNGSGTFYSTPNYDSLNAKELYARFYAQVSSNWSGEASGQIKIYQPLTKTGGVNNRIIGTVYNGARGNPLSARVAFQGTVNPGTTGNLASNTGQSGSAASVGRGQWNLFEVYVKGNTAGTNNGIFRMWVNGTLTHEYTDRQYDASDLLWRNAQITSVYGGSSGSVPYIQYIWIASPWYVSYKV